jgi:hypothetical protein
MSIVNELYKKPKRDKGVNAPRFQRPSPNTEQQADLLFLPDDNGFKYCLVVADVGSRLTDAQPIKDKTNANVLKAFQLIYKRNILSLPKQIDFDQGTEFKGTVAKWFEGKGIIVHLSVAYRHRQQGIVERKNQTIGKQLFMRMTEEELLTGVPSRQWISDLPKVIMNMNKKVTETKIPKPSDEYMCEGDACKVLAENTKVRVALNAPINVTDASLLHGKFRDTDIRWKVKPNIIKQVILQPNGPPMYLINDDKGNTDHRQAFTKNQLLVVKASEKQASEKAIRPVKTNKGQKVYLIEDLVDKKKIKGKIYYFVKWRGFSSNENTWEPLSNLIVDAPLLVKRYESTHK